MRANMTIRIFLTLLATCTLVGVLLVGCGSSKNTNGLRGDGSVELNFSVPRKAAISDFDWFFISSKYDDSAEVAFSNPYGARGVWEMCIWRKIGRGMDAQKEVYWVNIEIADAKGNMLGLEPGLDPSVAADVYAYQAFLESDEAKAAGIQHSDTASQLIEALNNLDGSVPARVTMQLVGIEDNDGNWRDISDAKPTLFEGKYFPDAMFIKIEDKKGNRITANNFLSNGNEQHAIGAFTPANNDPALNGAIAISRKTN